MAQHVQCFCLCHDVQRQGKSHTEHIVSHDATMQGCGQEQIHQTYFGKALKDHEGCNIRGLLHQTAHCMLKVGWWPITTTPLLCHLKRVSPDCQTSLPTLSALSAPAALACQTICTISMTAVEYKVAVRTAKFGARSSQLANTPNQHSVLSGSQA